MSIRNSSAVALLAIASVPFSVQAGSNGPDAAMDACVKAFVQTYVPNHPVRETKKIGNTRGALEVAKYPQRVTVELSARGLRSGELFAQARCVANRNGIVLVDNQPMTN